jgi:transcriptional regulator of acetoin/glycerol metabolism
MLLLGLKMVLSCRWLGCRVQGHRVAQAFQAVDEPTFHGPVVALVKVTGPKIADALCRRETDIDTICATLGISRSTLYRYLKQHAVDPSASS